MIAKKINLTAFFKQWYEGQGYPSYHVEWSQLGLQNVNIKMNQSTSDPSVSFFEMPVALKFKNAAQEKTIIVDNKTNGETFLKNIGFIADTVLIDPEYWLISKNNTAVKTTIVNTGNGAVEIYPNPVTNPFTIYLHDFSENNADIKIYNNLGQLVYSKNLQLYNGAEILKLSLGQLAKGVYIVKVKVGNNKIVKRIIQ